MRGIVINMEEAKLQTLEQIKAFLDGTSEVAFRVPKEDRNPFIERVLKRFGFSRMFSARNRDSSICSGVTTLPPGRFSFPAAAALTQLRKVCSISPKSFATAPAVWPDWTRFTASSLNSAVYSCFGIFFFVIPSM